MLRSVLAMVAVALCVAGTAGAEVHPAEELDLERYASRGAVGLYVPDRETLERGLTLRLLADLPSKTEVIPYEGPPLGDLPPHALDRIRFQLGKPGPPEISMEAPPRGEDESGLYPIAVVGEDFRGVLTSESTRIDGLVTLDDVVEGRLEWRADDNAVETVERLQRRIERNDDLRRPLTILLVVATIGLALVRPRLAPRLVLLALALNLWLSPALALAGALAAVALPLGLACAAVMAVYLAALGLDAETVALSPLGPSQVHRFYGINNLLETLLLLPALLGAALLGRFGVALAVLSVVTIAGNRFGADGGGLLVLLAGYGVLAVRLAGARLTRRRLLGLAAATVLIAVALVGLDAATGGSSHVTDAVGDGPGALAGDLADRIERSAERATASSGALAVVLACLGILGWAVTKRGEPVLDALLVALAVSLVVNDTPSDVLAAGAALAVTLVRLRAAPSPLAAELGRSPETAARV